MATFTINDASELITKKILVNRMSIECLEMQKEHIRSEMEIKRMNHSIAKQKIKLIEQLNSILEKQINEFDEIRQEECKYLTEDINALDRPTVEYNELLRKIHDLEHQMTTLVGKINYINQSIPETFTVTNYRVKPKLSTANTCAGEFAQELN